MRIAFLAAAISLMLAACGSDETETVIEPPETFLDTLLVSGKNRDPICYRMRQLAFWKSWTRGEQISWREIDADTWELTTVPVVNGLPQRDRRYRHVFRKEQDLIYLAEYDGYSEGQIRYQGGEDSGLMYQYLRMMIKGDGGAVPIQQIPGCTNPFFRVRKGV